MPGEYHQLSSAQPISSMRAVIGIDVLWDRLVAWLGVLVEFRLHTAMEEGFRGGVLRALVELVEEILRPGKFSFAVADDLG